MFDQTQRSIWLAEQLWPALRESFPDLKRIPQDVLITVGYPASGARGRSDKIKPAEINYQWTGNANEKAFISIHPVYFDSPINAAKALLFGASKVVWGARWGASKHGVSKADTGEIGCTPETQARLDKIMEEIGAPPDGFALPFPVRQVARTRLRKYVNATAKCSDGSVHPVIRAASDTLQTNCAVCGNAWSAA